MTHVQVWAQAVLNMWYPATCQGCGEVLLEGENPFCLHCEILLPRTRYELWPDNPVERIFWGRLPLEAATSLVHLRSGSSVHHSLHALKYRRQTSVGEWLGGQLGFSLTQSRFNEDYLLAPVPIHPKKLRTRGYNQCEIIARGMSAQSGWPVLTETQKLSRGPSQTGLNRSERWANVEGSFAIRNPEQVTGRHVMLVDDVVTTGATLEAFGRTLLKAQPASLSLATVAYTNR